MKVAAVHTHVISCPVERPFTSARGWLYANRASCIVEIETDAGVVGWGECYGPAAALKAGARRRVQAGAFFGHIAYAGLAARKPA